MKRVITFTAQQKNPINNRKARNILKVYIWNEVEKRDLNAKSIAYELGVNVRTAYRYLALIDSVKGEL